ncbi:hypothetical protein EMCRGX_G006470 [Ephydatia muelleri]
MSARLLGNLNAQVSFSHDKPSKCGFSDDIDTVILTSIGSPIQEGSRDARWSDDGYGDWEDECDDEFPDGFPPDPTFPPFPTMEPPAPTASPTVETPTPAPPPATTETPAITGSPIAVVQTPAPTAPPPRN